jgi:AAA domain
LPVRPGDLLVVDEASMVSTADLAAVEEIATRWGAKILLIGDTEQLSAPQAGGAMRLLAGEHGYYQLRTIQRFEQEWERDASLRLRAGDADALAGYDQRGRILDGTREQMADVAYQRWLADHLSGKDTMLLTTTNAQAIELARRARDELAALGLVATDELIDLADGNEAGVGDLIVARENARLYSGKPGRFLANRDVLRIDAWVERGESRLAQVRRLTGRDPTTRELRWSPPFELPEDYLERHVQLAYAGNVHVAQGRTVDTAHLVVDEAATRESLYVGMSRGRERNTAYVVTERIRAADLSAQPRPAPALEGPGAAAAQHPDRFAVLAEILGRERSERTATETLRQELEQAASLATLAPVWADVTRSHAARRYENAIRSMLAQDDWHRYAQDPERGTLVRLLRAAELAGHDAQTVLHQAIDRRDLAGARSIAAVLHSRVQWLVGTPEPKPAASYMERTPAIDDPEADQFARDLAAAMDERVSVLGNRAALDRPVWALRYLGEVPADPIARADWVRRAGAVAAYREERGIADEIEAIGPAPQRGSPEQRASWHAACVALQMPDAERQFAAATDGELWARRAAYERETRWAPPYVVGELREAHLAEDAYRADAVCAWYRADAATDQAERDTAQREAEANSALAQEVGAHREALAEVAEARQRWHAATEQSRQQALMADTELRRRHPDLELPPLHSVEEAQQQESEPGQAEPGVHEPEKHATPESRPGAARVDIKAALTAARRAQQILADRERHATNETELASDDIMHRREAEARQEADARRAAVRQEPARSRQAMSLDLDELELEAGQ